MNEPHVMKTPFDNCCRGVMFFLGLSIGLPGMALASLLHRLGAESSGPARYDVLPSSRILRRERNEYCYCFRTVDRARWICSTQNRSYSGAMDKLPARVSLIRLTPKKTGSWLGSPFRFRACGQSGMMLSELLPGLAQHADEITLIRIDGQRAFQSRAGNLVLQHRNHDARTSLDGLVDHLRSRFGNARPAGICRDLESERTARRWGSELFERLATTGLPGLRHASGRNACARPEADGPAQAAQGRLNLLRELNRQHSMPVRINLN